MAEDNGGGTDTVRSTVSYVLNDFVERLFLLGNKDIDATGNSGDNTLSGNTGDNILSGGRGADTLDGGSGNDHLRGGSGADTFGFATGYGRDEITDFANGDSIYVANWKAIGSFSQLKSHASQHGDDLWIVADKDTLVIDNFHKADLNPGDFQF